MLTLTFTLHKIINDPGIMNVHIVNVIAYHNEFGLEKYGTQIPMSLYTRYGATSNNGGIVPSIARNQPQAKPHTTYKLFKIKIEKKRNNCQQHKIIYLTISLKTQYETKGSIPSNEWHSENIF